MCCLCKIRQEKQSVSFVEAVWMVENQWQLELCYACQNFLKTILEPSLKEEGVGQADFTGVRPPNT